MYIFLVVNLKKKKKKKNECLRWWQYSKELRSDTEYFGTGASSHLCVVSIRVLGDWPSCAVAVPHVGAQHGFVVAVQPALTRILSLGWCCRWWNQTRPFFFFLVFFTTDWWSWRTLVKVFPPIEIVDRVKWTRWKDPEAGTTIGSHPTDVIHVTPRLQNSRHQIRSIVSPYKPSANDRKCTIMTYLYLKRII